MMRVSKHIRRFKKRDEGAAAVEFAICLPLLLLAFFVVVEFARLFFNYQAAVQGVRDATRYMARTVSEDICVNVTSTTKPADDAAEQGYAEETSSTDPALYYPIVLRNMQTEVQGLLPSNVQLLAVRSRSYCVAGAAANDFRDPTVPIAELEADFRILFPLVSILTLNNQPVIDPIEHTVNDQSRIYGI